MKTTIELPDDLLERGKAVARRENSTLKALVEEGLRMALKARWRKRAAPFSVQPFQGEGLTAEFAGAGWDQIRCAIHDARFAAICLAHGVAELGSADRDDSRFPALKVHNPLIG